ncbi:MAG: NADH-quinone oxidoreductase subunit NuoK [Gammaproteobacteria bacterium]|nr:NADH-quinone oxidoreductase subunit NuoK [Gammaproteobacteria bacterium]
MIPTSHYVILSAILFGLGLFGILVHRRNVILLMVCIELLLLAVNTNLVAFSHQFSDTAGEVFVFFILTVAAAEAAIGLAIVMLLYRNRGNISVAQMNHLKG